MSSYSAAGPGSSPSHEKDNFFRLSTLLIDGATKLLREVFNDIHHPATLPTVLAKPEIKKKLSKVRLFSTEREILYPSGGGTVTSDSFDITLVCKLLRNICNLTPPSSGSWETFPDPAHKSQGDDLLRIKICRNDAIAHVKELKLDNCKFEQLWKEVSSAMIRLAGNISSAKKTEWTSFISQCYSSAITSREQDFVEELKAWYDNDKCLKEEVEKLGQDVAGGFAEVKREIAQSSQRATEASSEKMDKIMDVVQTNFQKLEDIIATLQGKMMIEDQVLKKRLPDFREEVMPGQLLSDLQCLAIEDKERISDVESSRNPVEAVDILVESVARQENGFDQFVRALRKTGNGHVALLLDPHQEIGSIDEEDETDDDGTRNCTKIVGTAIDVWIPGTFYDKVTEEGASAVTDTVEAGKYSELEDEITEKYSDPGSTQTQELRKKLEEFLPSGVAFVRTEGPLVCVFRISSVSGAEKLWEMYNNGRFELTLKKLLLDHNLKAKDLNYKVLSFPVERHKRVCEKLKEFETEKSRESAAVQPVSEVSEVDEVTEAPKTSFEFNIPPVYLRNDNALGALELELREYQKELAKEALQGKNTIICAPTNSGKTFVAIHLVKEHLETLSKKNDEGKMPKKSPKVVFIVNTITLVSQQKERFQLYLEEPYKVSAMTGGRNIHIPLKKLLESNDIVVMTAQILVDALNNKGNRVVLSDISLLIFDECHHAQKEHPYNRIMEQYLDVKLRSGTRNQLPQVIGLTASLGAGKANVSAKAEEHILQVCGNLDAECVSTVRDNTEELSETVSNLDRQVFIVQKRDSDIFEEIINQIMKSIEQEMGRVNPFPPPDRSSQNYRNWLEEQYRQAATASENRDHVTYVEQLRKYHVALEINKTSRMKDAMENLEKHFRAQSEETTTAVDRELKKRYDQAKTALDDYVKTFGEPQNPKLLQLQRLLLKFMKDSASVSEGTPFQSTSKGIVFTTTRESTQALLNWMEETEELKDIINPRTIVGGGNSELGMTQHEQNDVIKRFKSGDVNVLLATNVAEEGLDISDCDFVIRYNVMGNEISSVQSRGRVRAKEGNFAILAGSESGVLKREQLNNYREILMAEAVARVQKMDPEEFLRKVHHLQKKSSESRHQKKTIAKQRMSEFQPDDVTFMCRKCKTPACQAHHIRVIRGTHYVVIAANFDEKVRFKPHSEKNKNIMGIYYKEKVHCRNCDEDWGVKVELNGKEYISIKVKSFTLIYSNGARQTPKKWKDVRFTVSKLTSEDEED